MNSKLRKYYSTIIGVFMTAMFVVGCSGQEVTVFRQSNGSVTEIFSEHKNVGLVTDSNKTSNGELTVHFIDVGQADCILLQQNNSFILVDAGNNEDPKIIKAYLEQQGVQELEAFIGTHKDEDHIGSADYVINSFKVGKVYFPKQTGVTKTFEDFVNAVKGKGLKLTVPKSGESFKFGEAIITILAPNEIEYEDSNNYSIVIRIDFGSTSFLLTGDAEAKSESEMLSRNINLEATVIKVGHHGSSSSTSKTFLDKVNPKYAVISVGKDNSYGHPSNEVMKRLKDKEITVFRTDENGSIVATSNGKEIKFNYNTETQTILSEEMYIDSKGNGLIKGNLSNSGEKIYHIPGGAYYDKTKAEQWFKSESEAQKNGFRKSLK